MNLAYKKILGKFTKVLGFGKTPPHVGKNSQIISFFFSENVPYVLGLIVSLPPLPLKTRNLSKRKNYSRLRKLVVAFSAEVRN